MFCFNTVTVVKLCYANTDVCLEMIESEFCVDIKSRAINQHPDLVLWAT